MELDYHEIGRRIAKRRKALGLRQSEVGERAGISDKYLSCIERATSIPSLQVIVRLAIALDTTVDDFLFGAVHCSSDDAGEMAELLRRMTPRQLSLTRSFLCWLREQDLE